MRRLSIVAVLFFCAVAGAAAYQRNSHWKEFHFVGTALKADLAHPDALIRSDSLSRLPRDLLKLPIARDVLSEDLAFYYEQHEDRMGFEGAVKRIAYEHHLKWSDRLIASIFDEPAEVALWRDGKGALRHYALVLRRGTLTKILQEAATAALKDRQLTLAGELDTAAGKVPLLALRLNPRRTLLIASQGERVVALSDPGLLFSNANAPVAEARAALAEWLQEDGVLARRFDLGERPARTSAADVRHTLAFGAPALSLGYGALLPGFQGLRFDFAGGWSSAVRLDPAALPLGEVADEALWHATPANPAACLTLPADWKTLRQVYGNAQAEPLPETEVLTAFARPGLACWYADSTLYTPLFVTRLNKPLAHRDASLSRLAKWALGAGEARTLKDGAALWRGADGKAALGVAGDFVAFSPDGSLVEKALDTVARTLPGVADQTPASGATLALATPRLLAGMTEREVLEVLKRSGDENLLSIARQRLPTHTRALAAYPPYRLDLAERPRPGWQAVEWRPAARKP